MATSGTVYSALAKASKLYVSWSISSQSVEGNYTDIAWSAGVYVGGTNKWYSNAVKITNVSINGVTVWSGGTYSNFTSSGTYKKGSGTTRVYHNSDGTKSISVSITGWFYDYGTKSGSNSFTLTTIPRATAPILSATEITIGDSLTIDLPRASDTFTHTVQYATNKTIGTIATRAGASAVWDTSNSSVYSSLLNSLNTATEDVINIVVTTYNGDTMIGSTQIVKLTIKVPDSILPTISSLSITEANSSVKSMFGSIYVKSLSELNITVDAQGSYGSEISSYLVSVDNINYTSQTFKTNTLKTSGTLPVVASVTDSRGRTAVYTTNITVSNYSAPIISSFTYEQCDESGEPLVSGNCTRITVEGSVFNINSKNSKSLYLYYKKVTDTSYTSYNGNPIALSEWDFSIDDIIIQNTSNDVTYEYKVVLKDKVYDASSTEKTVQKIIQTGITAMSFYAGGKGVTLFAEASQEGFIVSDGKNAKLSGNVYASKSVYIGGKTTSTDKKPGVTLGASGTVHVQSSSSPSVKFYAGSVSSPQATINSDSSGNFNFVGGDMTLGGEYITPYKILYDSGTTGTVTLNESAANFKMLEIIIGYQDVLAASVKVYSPDGKTTDISSAVAGASQVQVSRTRCFISGTSIVQSGNHTSAYKSSGFANTETNVYIRTVIGYR